MPRFIRNLYGHWLLALSRRRALSSAALKERAEKNFKNFNGNGL